MRFDPPLQFLAAVTRLRRGATPPSRGSRPASNQTQQRLCPGIYRQSRMQQQAAALPLATGP